MSGRFGQIRARSEPDPSQPRALYTSTIAAHPTLLELSFTATELMEKTSLLKPSKYDKDDHGSSLGVVKSGKYGQILRENRGNFSSIFANWK